MHRFRPVRAFPLLAFSLVLLGGCDHGEDVVGPGDDDSLLSRIQTEIFDTNCALSGCHVGGSAFAGLDLSSEQASYDNLVGVEATESPDLLRVDPNNADDSFLMIKLEGGPRLVGSRMPLGRPPLSGAQIQLVRDWIADGAPRE